MTTNCVNQFSDKAIGPLAHGTIGFLAASRFTSIDPIDGAGFGLAFALVTDIATSIFNQIFERPGASENSKMVGRVLNFVFSISVTLSICAAFGIQLTVANALSLIASQLFVKYFLENPHLNMPATPIRF